MRWHSLNKRYYESLGYAYTKMGDEFDVAIEHLPHGSHARVRVQCDSCGKVRSLEWRMRKDRCHDCYINSPETLERLLNVDRSESVREKISATLKQYYSDNEGERERLSRQTTEYYADPTHREEARQRGIVQFSNPDMRRRMSEIRKAQMSDPEFRKRYEQSWENRRGEKSPCYNPNKTWKERERHRHLPRYKAWRMDVYRRDGFT